WNILPTEKPGYTYGDDGRCPKPGENWPAEFTCTIVLTYAAESPRNATLTVIKQVINDEYPVSGNLRAENFTIMVNGSAIPTPSTFNGSEAGLNVTFSKSGTYA